MQLATEMSSADLHPAIAKATSRGIHDTAQPLTVLQGLLELTLEQAKTVDDYRESLTLALSEIARVTACFENVRQLVRLQQPAPDVCNFSILQTVRDVLNEMPTANVSFTSGPEDMVHASQSRVRQGLSVLIAAIASNSAGNVKVCIEPQAQMIAIRIEMLGDTDALASNLEIAALIVASAGGELRLSETVGSVLLVLPKAVIDHPIDKKGTLNHV